MQPQPRNPKHKQNQHPENKESKKSKTKGKIKVSEDDFIRIFKSTKKNQQGETVSSQLMGSNLKNISFKQIQQAAEKLKTSIQIYYPKISELLSQTNKPLENLDNKQENSLLTQAELFLNDFHIIMKCLKQLQFPAPLADTFFTQFVRNMKVCLQKNLIKRKDIFSIWIDIPIRNFKDFLAQLQLKDIFNSFDEEKIINIFGGLLHDQKLTQCCTYYCSYNKNLKEFEDQLASKIANSDQILSPQVNKLLCQKQSLKNVVIKKLDLAKAVILVEQLGEDPRQYPQLEKFILRKHYLAMKREYKNWYTFEDKMSFNSQFIEMYCSQAESAKQAQKIEANQEEQNQLESEILTPEIIFSIRVRNNIITKETIKQQDIYPNPLYKLDQFTATQNIVQKYLAQQLLKSACGDQKLPEEIKNNSQSLLLSDYGFSQNMVHFISESSSQQFKQMSKDVLSSPKVGFDAENRCTSTKYQQQGVSLIQLSIPQKIYILDYLSMENDEAFIEFFHAFLSSQKIIKIGHTVNSDIKYLEKTSKLVKCEGFVDISSIFKSKFPYQTLNSLAFMVEKLIGKKLCKFEQRSNWNRRPLKKSQLHYAALDALVCEILYDILKQDNVQTFKTHQKQKTKPLTDEIIREDNLSYAKKFSYILQEKIPKFLVDSMLKKLCTIMRNLGIDTEYMAVSNYDLLKTTAEKQNRIILTRDTKLLKKSKITAPIYCIQQKGDSDLMFEQVKSFFKINLELFDTLSRCVKCNCGILDIITKEEAMKTLVFQYQDCKIEEFWRCSKCKQIYWEGNQFKNAKNKFEGMKQDQ